jgi:hypothetical protein
MVDRQRLFRGLRIAWTVGFGILCLLLIALWVRSYWWIDVLAGPDISDRLFSLTSNSSGLTLAGYETSHPAVSPWSTTTFSSLNTHRSYFLFTIAQGPEVCGAQTPHWFAVTLFATLAAVPWIRWRFSLCTLLIAVTLVAVGMGLIVYFAKTME